MASFIVHGDMSMNKRIKSKWLRALRSGKYTQTTNTLRREVEDGHSHCCLGVLCDIHSKEKGRRWSSLGKYQTSSAFLPPVVRKWAGIDSDDPKIPKRGTLSSLNDRGYKFPTIADLIEKHL